jgi:MATE family multidrug resistance protein
MIFSLHTKQWWKILKLAWPLIIANSFWNLQVTIDRFFLGQFSTESLGASVVVMGVFWTPMALLQQTVSYVTTFVAQYRGAQRLPMIGKATWQSVYLSLLGGFLLIGLIPLASDIFQLFGHSQTMTVLEEEYFISLLFSGLPVAVTAAVSGYFTGLGRTKVILIINAVGLILNAILDYCMIFGHWGFPALGIRGAGYATALGSLGSAVVGMALMLLSPDASLHGLWSQWRFDRHLAGEFLKYGLPSGAQWALEGLAFTVFLMIVGMTPQGDALLAASSIAVTIMMLSILPAMGIAQTVCVLVGQHLGEKSPDEAVLSTISGAQLSFVYMLLMALTFALFPQFYIGWFHNPSDTHLWPRVSELIPTILLFVSFFTLFDSLNFPVSFALKGAGDTRFVSLVALTAPWPIMILPSYLLKTSENALFYIWGAASCYSVFLASIYIWRFYRGSWRSMSVIGKSEMESFSP